MIKVLFVCTGNICRSPMAEFYLKECNRNSNIPFRSFSAGTHACAGSPASEESLNVMNELGISLKTHEGKQVNEYMVTHADLVLVMERGHKKILGENEAKIRLLSDFDPQEEGGDIPDPYGGPIDLYRRVRDKIIACIDHFVLMCQEEPV